MKRFDSYPNDGVQVLPKRKGANAKRGNGLQLQRARVTPLNPNILFRSGLAMVNSYRVLTKLNLARIDTMETTE